MLAARARREAAATAQYSAADSAGTAEDDGSEDWYLVKYSDGDEEEMTDSMIRRLAEGRENEYCPPDNSARGPPDESDWLLRRTKRELDAPERPYGPQFARRD